MRILFFCLLSLVAVGCSTPAATRFSATTPDGNKISLAVGGEVVAEDLQFRMNYRTGECVLVAKKWRSKKQGVIRETYSGQAALVDSSGKLVGYVSEGVVKGLVKGVIPLP